MRFSCLAGGNSPRPWPCVNVPSHPFGWYFLPALSSLLTCMHQPVLCWTLQGTFCTARALSLCAALSLLALGAMNSSCFGLPSLSVSSTQLRGPMGLHHSSPSLHHGLVTFQAVSWENGKTHIYLFPVDQESMSFVAWWQGLKNRFSCSFVFFFFLVLSDGRINLVPFYSFWPKVDIELISMDFSTLVLLSPLHIPPALKFETQEHFTEF